MSAPAFLARLQTLGIKLRLDGDKLRYDGPRDKLTPAVLDELRAHKVELIEFLRGTATVSGSGMPAIEPAPRDADLALSFPQERLWFVDKLGAGSAYNIRLAVRLSGALDVGALEESLRRIVRRHEVLRTTFTAIDGRPVQRIAREPGVRVERVDLRALPEADREAAAQGLVAERVRQPFDLAVGPLLRSALIELGDREHVLLLVVHHIVFDGWSMSLLKRELSEHYRALTSGESPSLPELRVQYADFAHWQNRWLRGEVLDSLLRFWRGELGADLPMLELPVDRSRPAKQTFRGEVHRFVLPPNLTAALEDLGRVHRTSLTMTLLAAFQVLIARWTGQDDVVVGSPIANRNRSEIENLIGFFVNTLVFRSDLSDDPTFTEFLSRVRRKALGAYDNQDLPFERLVEELAPERDLGHNPLFQVVFALQNAPPDELDLPGLTVGEFESDFVASRLDLEAHLFSEDGRGLRGRFVYNPDLFDAATIERLAGYFHVLLEGIAAEPETRVSRLPLLRPAERRRLVEDWNDTGTPYPRDSSIAELFEEQVALRPDAVAVEFEDRALTYSELNRRANRVARYLIRHGVGPGVKVGVALERSLEMVVGVLGVLKAGGAYVPLDPGYPKSRLAYVVEETRAPVLLTQAHLDADWDSIAAESAENPGVRSGAEDLAYVMYTSGSTGRPKGSCIAHRSVVRLVKETNYIGVGPEDVFLQFAPISFDASTLELWGSLLNGAKLVVFPPRTPSLEELGLAIERHGVTTLWLTGALFQQMVDTRPGSFRGVRQLLAGGDALSVPHVRRVIEDLDGDRVLINGYGPTENTTFTCCHVMGPGSRFERSVPIGRPIANTQVYILDRWMEPVPIGVPGELYAGGDGLAREYLDDPVLTAEKLVPSPFGDGPGSRLYRTGDRARYLPDGTIEFLGRIDHQVKVRGFRIEPGEIQTALMGHEAVQEAVVLCREDDPGDKYLAAYVVVEGEETDGSLRNELRELLGANLPPHMVPTAFVFLDSLPLTPNGKVDRRALPAPSGEREDRPHVEPRGETEKRLAGIWAELLGVDRVGADDDFFDLGGHSLLAMRVLSRVSDAFRVDMPLESFFGSATVGEMARHLDAIRRARASSEGDDAAAEEREVFEL